MRIQMLKEICRMYPVFTSASIFILPIGCFIQYDNYKRNKRLSDTFQAYWEISTYQ